MWTLLFLCCVLTTHGVRGADSVQSEKTEPNNGDASAFYTSPPDIETATPDVRCGGFLYSSSGSFYSPNYPGMYPSNSRCTWYIRPSSQIIELEFTDVNIENHPNCGFDYIAVYDGSSTGSRLLGKICGRNTTIFHSTGSYLTVFFMSDSVVQEKGFRAEYRIVAGGSCKYNCGYQTGNCSCFSSCGYRGNCCPDYEDECSMTTWNPPTTASLSCRYNCGRHLGSCSCSSSCQYYGNCCHDYYSYCSSSTVGPTTAQPSCRYNCGRHLGSCSCSSSCQYYGNCCYDYYSYCQTTTGGRPSCRYNCGRHLGSCSCSSSCRYNGNCCHDYYSYCASTTVRPTTAQPSCRYNCGRHLGSCSCSSSCQYNGNCCHDYYSYCASTTVRPTTAQPSCRYNCGRHLGSCSCSSSCQYYGNCCRDYYYYCAVTTTEGPCGGTLFGSGTFYSPNYPNYYHDNAYCVWNLKAAHDQRVFLEFKYLQLENCCDCDYIAVYDGPSIGSQYLGKACNNLTSFQSSSNYLTVVFRTDGSVVGRGFSAEFITSLKASSGQVYCSSERMNIVIGRNYLNSLGYSSHNLYLNNQYCRPSSYGSWVVFNFSISSCGNERKFDNGRVVYTNTLRAYKSNYGEVTRQSLLTINISCTMDQDSVSQNMYVVQHSGNSTIIGTGRFNTTMTFYSYDNFKYPVTADPYEVELNEYVYVQVGLTGAVGGLVIFLDTCVSSPSPYDFHNRLYYIVRNGCPADNTYYAYISGTSSIARFRFKTFQFLRAFESVYLQCKVLICRENDYNSRCRRGCSKRTARDLGSKHEIQTLVVGPIKLKEPVNKEEGTNKQNNA